MNWLISFFQFCRDLFKSRGLIWELTKRDLRTKYLGSYLGIIWALIQPTITIVILWFVFEVGFKSQPVQDTPFVLWLISGIIPWFFFAECLSNGTYAVIENSFLVKKMVFRVSVLPIVKIFSAFVVHFFFLVLVLLIFLAYGFKPDLYNLQILYYLAGMVFLALGVSWVTSSLIVFLRDVGQFVSMVLQFGFWITPVFWSISILPPRYRPIILLNPVHYLIEGYRNSFIDKVWFWEKPGSTLYFWLFSLTVFAFGALLFRRLRPHFADVL